MSIRPTQGLVINSTFTYLDAKIKKFTGINSGGITANFAGANVPYTPKYQIGTNIDYEFPVSDSLNAFVGAGLTFRSEVQNRAMGFGR